MSGPESRAQASRRRCRSGRSGRDRSLVGYLTRLGDAEAAAAAVGEARDIAGTLRCQPLLDRAAIITPAAIPVRD
jgi:hypothetical protein